VTRQIIDSNSGQLCFDKDFFISQSTRQDEIINFFGQQNVEIKDVYTGWKHFTIRNVKVNDSYFTLTLYFDREILRMLSFIVSDKLIVTGSWDNWSEKKELENREYYDDWLTKQIGNNRKFNWGTVDAFYDNKGGFSHIFLKYDIDKQNI
jgi:hypothetical protein